MNTIIFATANQHKIAEIQALLGKDYHIVSPAQAGVEGEIPENQNTLEGNAIQKAKHIHTLTRTPCFADDTGLEVEALDGAPGVYSARYAGEDKDTAANNRKLLDALDGQTNRRAQFRTIIALIDHDGAIHLFEGRAEGEILSQPAGEQGFGYDPIFRPNGHTRSFAQMTMDEKNPISHRGKAIAKLAAYLRAQARPATIESPRIGTGYDVHALAPGLELWLGGIKIDHHKGCIAHSDGDVLIHAICDALLGAAALGDIGTHFPDTSEEYKNIDSKILLRRTAEIIRRAGYSIINIDATVSLQAPRLRPHIDAMRHTLATVVEIPVDRISIKATTTEKLGFTGREEGIAAQAVAALQLREAGWQEPGVRTF